MTPAVRGTRIAQRPRLVIMSVSALPRSSPESQGIDPVGILAFVDALESAPDIEMHSVMIIRHGQVVAEGWWPPYAPELVHLLYSLSRHYGPAQPVDVGPPRCRDGQWASGGDH